MVAYALSYGYMVLDNFRPAVSIWFKRSFDSPAASWEGDIFSSHLKNYDHTWMDTLCLFGSAVWGRFRIANTNGSKESSPIKTTPITIVKRINLDVWKKYR